MFSPQRHPRQYFRAVRLSPMRVSAGQVKNQTLSKIE